MNEVEQIVIKGLESISKRLEAQASKLIPKLRNESARIQYSNQQKSLHEHIAHFLENFEPEIQVFIDEIVPLEAINWELDRDRLKEF